MATFLQFESDFDVNNNIGECVNALMVLFFCLISISTQAFDFEVKSLEAVKGLTASLPSEKTLIIWDLDNTLLRPERLIGSEQWFEWQAEKVKNQEADRVATDFPALLQIQNKILDNCSMLPTEERGVALVQELDKRGFTQIILTSRGPGEEAMTHRQLEKNKLKFGIPEAKDFVLLENQESFEACGLDQQGVEKYQLKAAKKSIYSSGVIFSEGQHKGVVLKCYLHKTGLKFDNIVFVDNIQKQTDRVDAVYPEVTTILYKGMEAAIADFNANQRGAATQEFEKFNSQVSFPQGTLNVK